MRQTTAAPCFPPLKQPNRIEVGNYFCRFSAVSLGNPHQLSHKKGFAQLKTKQTIQMKGKQKANRKKTKMICAPQVRRKKDGPEIMAVELVLRIGCFSWPVQHPNRNRSSIARC